MASKVRVDQGTQAFTSVIDLIQNSRPPRLRLYDGYFSQNNVGERRITEIRIYSPEDIEIVDGYSKVVKIQKEFFRFPSFSRLDQFDAYLQSVYWNVIHLGNDQYRILAFVKGLGGGSFVSSEVSAMDQLTEGEKKEVLNLLKETGREFKTKEDIDRGLDEALSKKMLWVIFSSYELGGVWQRVERPFYRPQVAMDRNAMSIGKRHISLLLKAGADPSKCLETAYLFNMREERNPTYVRKHEGYDNSHEKDVRSFLMREAKEHGARMTGSLLAACTSEEFKDDVLIRDWVLSAEPDDLDEELIVRFFSYSNSKEERTVLNNKMIDLIRRGGQHEDFLFYHFLQYVSDETYSTYLLSILNSGYVMKDPAKAAELAIQHSKFVDSNLWILNVLLERGARPSQATVDRVFGEGKDFVARVLYERGMRPSGDLDSRLQRAVNTPALVRIYLELGANPSGLSFRHYCEMYGSIKDSREQADCLTVIRRLAQRGVAPEDNIDRLLVDAVIQEYTPLIPILVDLGARKTTDMLVRAIKHGKSVRHYFQLLMQAAGDIELVKVKAALTDALTELCTELCMAENWTQEKVERLAFLLQYGASFTTLPSRVYRFLPNALQQILNNCFREDENFKKAAHVLKEKCIFGLPNNQYQKLEERGVVAEFENLMDQIVEDSLVVIGLYNDYDDEVVVLREAFAKFLAEKLDSVLGKTSLAFQGGQLNKGQIKEWIRKECVTWLSDSRRKIGIDMEKERKQEENKRSIIEQFEQQRQVLLQQKEVMSEQLRASERARGLSEEQIDELRAVNVTLEKIEKNQRFSYYY